MLGNTKARKNLRPWIFPRMPTNWGKKMELRGMHNKFELQAFFHPTSPADIRRNSHRSHNGDLLLLSLLLSSYCLFLSFNRSFAPTDVIQSFVVIREKTGLVS